MDGEVEDVCRAHQQALVPFASVLGYILGRIDLGRVRISYAVLR
jgi:hypothetical protein